LQVLAVRQLFFSQNILKVLPAKMFAGEACDVALLQLDDNQITTIDPLAFFWFSKLEVLYMNNNFITAIESSTFSWTPNLNLLGIRGNLLARLPTFPLLPSFQQLIADLNPLQLIIKEDLAGVSRSLSGLWLAGTDMTASKLGPGVFSQCTKLSFVQLQGNLLSTLPDDLFAGCIKTLNTIKLSVGFARRVESFPRAHSMQPRQVNQLTVLPSSLLSALKYNLKTL
jgi:Leucine-rich repeat (LRR) protein